MPPVIFGLKLASETADFIASKNVPTSFSQTYTTKLVRYLAARQERGANNCTKYTETAGEEEGESYTWPMFKSADAFQTRYSTRPLRTI